MTTIDPSDANIIYSPYNWLVASGSAKTINAGAYFRVMFSGTPTTLAATFNVANQPSGKTRISIRVDNGPWQNSQIAASVPITMPADTWGTHTVEFVMRSHAMSVDRWASPQPTAVIFTGLTADVTITSRAARKRPLRGFTLGDSMGEGIAAWANTPGGFEDNHDSRLGWSYPLGELLGAEIGPACFGGMAYSDATSSAGVPKAPTNAPFLWSGQARDITTTPPDFIVVNLGTNDALHANADATITADTTATLNAMLAATPSTTKLFVVPGWGSSKAPAVQAGVAATTSPSRITFIDTTGWWSSSDASDSLHPYGYINTYDLAPRLAGIIRTTLGASSAIRFYMRDAAGNAVPVTTG